MIVVRLSGGLGNQLFQYAAGRRLAQRRQAELVLDLGWYERTPRRDTPRDYELAHYPIQARIASGTEKLWCRLHEGPVLRRLDRLPRRWRHRREKGFAFDPAVLELPNDVYLDGYWQSYRYFDDIAALIQSELTPLAPMGPRDEELAGRIRATNSVAVHIRRGDYVTNAAASRAHGLCSAEYYDRALSRIAAAVDPHFFVFSDDPAWARSSMKFPGPFEVIDHNGPERAFQDLRLMAMCKHQITANSSFSWWGAWLNANPAKIVLTPAQWFVKVPNTSSLCPSDWLRC